MKVRLGESNELQFMLSIKGTTSDPNATQPRIRFLVTETKTGMSICFPMERLEEGKVGVKIPALPMFQEGNGYTGQVEVIVGSRWFNPTTVDLVFEREVEVEAAPILLNEKGTRLSVEELDTEEESPEPQEEFMSVIKPDPKDRKRTNLGEDVVRGIFFSEKPEETRKSQNPVGPVTVPKPQKKTIEPGTQKLKDNLKSMISEAWNELE